MTMSQNTARASEIMRMLRKSNTNGVSLKQQVGTDKARFDQFSRTVDGLLLDYSRTSIDSKDFRSLLELAECCGIDEMRERMYAGEHLNFTEDRAVLHPVWRENFVTDNGNHILDVQDLAITNPLEMENRLNQIPGIVTVGLFAQRPADILLIGSNTGVRELRV